MNLSNGNIALFPHDATTMDTGSKLSLYLANRPLLVRYATPIVGGTTEAEDVVQDAWLRFAEGPPGDVERPLPYLYRIVRNLALDARRRQSRQGHPADDGELAGVACELSSPERHATAQAELRQLQQALACLPARTRVAFELHRLGGLSYQAIAERLGISAGAAHQRVREALAHCMGQMGDD